MRFIFVWLAFGCICQSPLAIAATIIHAGRLIDGKSGEAKTEMSIVVEDGRITKVVAGYMSAGGWRQADPTSPSIR